MMKEVIRDIASGNLPLIGTLAFVTAFVLIVIRVVFMTKSEILHIENLPLEDEMDVLSAQRESEILSAQRESEILSAQRESEILSAQHESDVLSAQRKNEQNDRTNGRPIPSL